MSDVTVLQIEALGGREYTIPLGEIEQIEWKQWADGSSPRIAWKATVFWKSGNPERHLYLSDDQKEEFLEALRPSGDVANA